MAAPDSRADIVSLLTRRGPLKATELYAQFPHADFLGIDHVLAALIASRIVNRNADGRYEVVGAVVQVQSPPKRRRPRRRKRGETVTVTIDPTRTRYCIGCQTEKPLGAFQGNRTRCKACIGDRIAAGMAKEGEAVRVSQDAALNTKIDLMLRLQAEILRKTELMNITFLDIQQQILGRATT